MYFFHVFISFDDSKGNSEIHMHFKLKAVSVVLDMTWHG